MVGSTYRCCTHLAHCLVHLFIQQSVPMQLCCKAGCAFLESNTALEPLGLFYFPALVL